MKDTRAAGAAGWGPWRRFSCGRPENYPLPLAYRQALLEESAGPPPPGARSERLARVEAALFAADEPLPPRKLAQVAGLRDTREARQLVRQLRQLYDEEGSAFQVEEIAGGFQLLTRPEYHPWLVRWQRTAQDLHLTPAARETLAIVAYRQPITRADIEVIRGVHCGETLRLLLEKGLIRILGRHDSLGRPVLYGTTRKFLQVFGLRSLKDLPAVEGLAPPAEKPPAAE
jgi:segregation and condensation protein B